MNKFSMVCAIAVISSGVMPSVAYGGCYSQAEEETRFAAEPRSDEDARSQFQSLCRESERERANREECGGESHSACFCAHFNARARTKAYLKAARESCERTQQAAANSACVAGATSENCMRAASAANEVAASGEDRSAQLASEARRTAEKEQGRVNETRRTAGADLAQMINMTGRQLRGPTPSAGR